MRDLIAKLEALDGPNREVDAEILGSLDGEHNLITRYYDAVIGWDTINGLGVRTYGHPAPLTASLDAAVALVERVLPDHAREMSVWPGSCHVTILMTDENGFHNSSMGRFEALHEIEAITLLIATLKALEARDG